MLYYHVVYRLQKTLRSFRKFLLEKTERTVIINVSIYLRVMKSIMIGLGEHDKFQKT